MINDILTSYYQLRDYCDRFFESIAFEFRPYIQCRVGCSSCCNLESVSALEGHIIQDYLSQHPLPEFTSQSSACVFLQNDECLIYKVRPLICRTHGLIIADGDKATPERTCDLNFRNVNLRNWNSSYTLNMDRITENLIRLNILFLHIRGDDINDVTRLSLRQLIHQ